MYTRKQDGAIGINGRSHLRRAKRAHTRTSGVCRARRRRRNDGRPSPVPDAWTRTVCRRARRRVAKRPLAKQRPERAGESSPDVFKSREISGGRKSWRPPLCTFEPDALAKILPDRTIPKFLTLPPAPPFHRIVQS